MITASDLKRSKWIQTAHADGSDMIGRFWVNLFRCDDHPRVTGSRKQWRRRDLETVLDYHVDGESVGSLDIAAEVLNRGFTAGDDARGVGTDD
jgi:hypothetical protein